MLILMTHKRQAIWISALLAALLLVAGCAGIQPYNPPNHREEGPQKGLFTGSEGEFVIFRRADEQKKDSHDQQRADETRDGAAKDDGQSQDSE
jgi:hypothetical protein